MSHLDGSAGLEFKADRADYEALISELNSQTTAATAEAGTAAAGPAAEATAAAVMAAAAAAVAAATYPVTRKRNDGFRVRGRPR